MKDKESMLEAGVLFLNAIVLNRQNPAEGLAVLAIIVAKYLKKNPEFSPEDFLSMLSSLRAK